MKVENETDYCDTFKLSGLTVVFSGAGTGVSTDKAVAVGYSGDQAQYDVMDTCYCGRYDDEGKAQSSPMQFLHRTHSQLVSVDILDVT